MNLKAIGANVKKFRLMKQLTQFDLAELVDISTVHMSHIETGSVSMSLDCLLEVCRALEVTPNDILLGEFRLSDSCACEMLQNREKTLTQDENRLLIEMAKLLEDLKINRKKLSD